MTTTKKPVGREVVSLDELAKQKRDALPEPVTFELSGVEFTCPAIKSLPMNLQEKIGSLENGFGLLQETLGKEKVREMTAAGYTLGDMELIAEEWLRRNGIDPGEFQASPVS
ncbi:hypothetical protein GCM10010099_21050 [Streptomyces cinereus]|nr:hypothetical protein GCM10010099_21050 [Streptomyces cinereus]